MEEPVNKANRTLCLNWRPYQYLNKESMKLIFTALSRPHFWFWYVALAPRYQKGQTVDRKCHETSGKNSPGSQGSWMQWKTQEHEFAKYQSTVRKGLTWLRHTSIHLDFTVSTTISWKRMLRQQRVEEKVSWKSLDITQVCISISAPLELSTAVNSCRRGSIPAGFQKQAGFHVIRAGAFLLIHFFPTHAVTSDFESKDCIDLGCQRADLKAFSLSFPIWLLYYPIISYHIISYHKLAVTSSRKTNIYRILRWPPVLLVEWLCKKDKGTHPLQACRWGISSAFFLHPRCHAPRNLQSDPHPQGEAGVLGKS